MPTLLQTNHKIASSQSSFAFAQSVCSRSSEARSNRTSRTKMPTKGIESISKEKVSGVWIFILARLEACSRCSITRTGYSMPSRSALSFHTTTILLPLTLIAGRACPQHPDEFFKVTSISVLLFHCRSALAAFLRLRYCHGILSRLHGCRFVPMSDEDQ